MKEPSANEFAAGAAPAQAPIPPTRQERLARLRVPLYCHADHDRELRAASAAFGALRSAALVRRYAAREPLALGGGLRCVPVPLPHPRVPELRTDPTYTQIVGEVVALLGSATDLAEEE